MFLMQHWEDFYCVITALNMETTEQLTVLTVLTVQTLLLEFISMVIFLYGRILWN